jgi:hypothetical protein
VPQFPTPRVAPFYDHDILVDTYTELSMSAYHPSVYQCRKEVLRVA